MNTFGGPTFPIAAYNETAKPPRIAKFAKVFKSLLVDAFTVLSSSAPLAFHGGLAVKDIRACGALRGGTPAIPYFTLIGFKFARARSAA
jgi:hypothetical protein